MDLFWNTEVESDDGSHLVSINVLGPGRLILIKRCIQALTIKRATYFTNVTEYSLKLCNNSNQTLLSNTLTFARSLGSCWKPRPSASVFNTSLGVWQALMHEKPCLIPILYVSLLTLIPGCLRSGLSWFNCWVSFAPEFQCCYICESRLFYLSFNSDFYVSKIMHLWARNLSREPNNSVSEEPRQK